ncbi:MAG: signal peptidase I [Anaerolineae bacterium]
MEEFGKSNAANRAGPTSPEAYSTMMHSKITHADSLGRSVLNLVRNVLETVLPAIVLAFLITHFVGQRTLVLSCSMEPNLHENQQLIVDKLTYHFRQPERGEIVVIDMGEGEIPLIKRVVGLPGETLEIKDNRVLIDGQVLSEPYLAEAYQRDYGPVTIPKDSVFVMGDNRNNSRDSRMIGAITLDRIVSRAWVRVWPVEDIGLLK